MNLDWNVPDMLKIKDVILDTLWMIKHTLDGCESRQIRISDQEMVK